MSPRSVSHGTFAIERAYAASPARVFAAWADPAAKAVWFVGPGGWKELRREIDIFCDLFARPAVMEGLRKFVEGASAHPYLP